MGNSMGCVRAPGDAELVRGPPLSSKRRLRFRRKHKGRTNRNADVGGEPQAVETKPSFVGTLDSSSGPSSHLMVSKLEHRSVRSPDSADSPTGSLLGPGIPQAQHTPKLSPAWRGIFCLPGEDDAFSAVVDVSDIPRQTTTASPAYTAPPVSSTTTPGGGRVCRVREKIHGVLETPCIFEDDKANKCEMTLGERIKRRAGETLKVMPSVGEYNSVVHIREVDGKLCVVRTVYPSDYGSPAWRAESEHEVEVHREPAAPFPGNSLKVQLSEDEGDTDEDAFDRTRMPDDLAGKGLASDTPSRARERCVLLESGYASDLPLTSPETVVTTPSRADWQTLTGSSSERLDTMAESPQALQRQQAADGHQPQISEIYVCGDSGDLTAKEKLLLWSQQATEGYPGLRCVNFTSSWSDGRMFNALLHRYRPDLISMEAVSQQSNRENLEQAFEIAESLGVTRLLDAEDVDVPSPDEKSVITYVSSIYDAFPKIPEGGEGIAAHEVDQRWSEYQSRFSSLLQWSRQQTAVMANKNFPQNPVELKALYNEYVHLKETEIPAKELEKSHVAHLYKLLEVWMEFGRLKLPQGLHPNDLEEEWGRLILEMLDREKVLRPAVDRLELLLQRANKFQKLALDCEEKLTLAKNTLQADASRAESGEALRCESELTCYLRDCEALVAQTQQELNVLRDDKYYQVEQLAFRASCLREELASLRLECSGPYGKGRFDSSAGGPPRPAEGPGLSAGPRRLPARAAPVAASSSEDEGGLRFIYELLGWAQETQELAETAEWGADLPSVEKNLREQERAHAAAEELAGGLREARDYEAKVSSDYRSNYSEALAQLERQYGKLLERSSWRLRSLESLFAFVRECTEELIWLNEREEDEIAFDWSHNNSDMDAKRELYSELRRELDHKRGVMRSLQETARRLCQEEHPAKHTVEAYGAALQTQWRWVEQLCVCVERHLNDNTPYFRFMSDARDCESYLRQLLESIRRKYACDRNSRLSRLEDLLQDSMEEKEQLIEQRGKVASLVSRAKTLVQLRPRCADCPLVAATPVRAVCDYKQIETNVQITITRGDECVLEDNGQRSMWKVISPTGNEATVPSVCFTVPPPNREAVEAAGRTEQLYQQAMSSWHQLHVDMKSVVSWHYLLKDLDAVSQCNLDTVRNRSPSERQRVVDHLDSRLSDFLSDSRESSLFAPAERSRLEADVRGARQRCRDLLLDVESEEKDEAACRSFVSELRDVGLRLDESERGLIAAVQTAGRSADGSAENAVRVAEQEKLMSELDALRSSTGDVSRRCVAFLEDKAAAAAAGVAALRSELNRTVEKTDKLHHLSSVFLQKLKTVDVLLRCLEEAESHIGKYESRLSEEDVLPADTAAVRRLRDQLGTWQRELSEREVVFRSLRSDVLRADEAASRLAVLRPDRGAEPERCRERADRAAERWEAVKKQMETRRAELEGIARVLQQYRAGRSELTAWIDETTRRQENAPAGDADSKTLSEQLAQQTALVTEIEENQSKLDECQIHSKRYCASVKDYELQLMTFRAFVESTHKSPVKRRRTHSSSDAVAQEFMDLRTRYTALVTLTTQHVKYISDALRRLEEEEKETEEEKQARAGQVSDLLAWIGGLRGRAAESSLAAQQATNEQLAAKKDDVAEAVRSARVFLLSKRAAKLSTDERALAEAQLDRLTSAYRDACEASAQQMRQLAREEERKIPRCVAGVIDLGSVETFPVFQAARRGLIDRDTGRVLLEAQLVTTGRLLSPDAPLGLSLDQSLTRGSIDAHTRQSLSELENALLLAETATGGQQPNVHALATAVDSGIVREEVGLRILELQMREDSKLLSSRSLQAKLESRLQRKELIDPNTAEKVNLPELLRRCVPDDGSGLLLLPVKQQPGGSVCLRSGRKVGIFRAIEEGLIDRQVAERLLDAQLFAGGIVDPRSGHRLTVHEAVRHGLMDQDLACCLFVRQLKNGGILDPVTGERLDVEESIDRDLLSSCMALLVLESLWTFMGMLWPESGEVLSIVEALQQGVITAELARNILRQRNSVGALYNLESLQLLPFEEVLDASVVHILKDIRLPDVLLNTNPSGTPSLNRLSWGSSGSSPLAASPASLTWDAVAADGTDADQQAEHKLLFHLMTRSYVDAHSGKRIVLFEPELLELVNAIQLKAGDTDSRGKVKTFGSFTTQNDVVKALTLMQKQITDRQTEAEVGTSSRVTQNKDFKSSSTNGQRDSDEAKPESLAIVGINLDGSSETVVDKSIRDEEKGLSRLESSTEKLKSLEEKSERVTKDEVAAESKVLQTALESENIENILIGSINEHCYFKHLRKPDGVESEQLNQEVSKLDKPVVDIPESASGEEDAELSRLVSDLTKGGLMMEDGEMLLPDEAVARGILPGHTAVKLMARVGLFGGFLDRRSGESLSIDDVMREGLLDEDLMWSVLKSDKTLAGIVDVEKNLICGVREAAQAGLIDANTATRLLEAQVASGGIVDLRRDKKVSVILASNLGLIEGAQREQLVALERAYKGKVTGTEVALTKASLQLQMEGVIDPETACPVPLDQAIAKRLINPKHAYQVLLRQVAEGGIIHHASGMRLSVSDAVGRGLVDRSLAPGLEEMEWAYQGKGSSSNTEAVALQLSTGAIFDHHAGCKVTLSQAVARGLLDEDVGSEAVAIGAATQGVVDPQTALIVPYSDLVRKGKIDVETGKRFLEVKPFSGIENTQTRSRMTFPEALAAKQVDPIPALRLLQSQADSGGIVDITTGERLPLPEATENGLVSEDMVLEIATDQIMKGGLVNPVTGQRVLNLSDAVALRLISGHVASEIQKKWSPLEIKIDDDSSPTITSSQSAKSTVSPEVPLWDDGEALTSAEPIDVMTEVDKSLEPDKSIDLLRNFAANVEKRIQQAIEEAVPQIGTAEKIPKPKPVDKLQICAVEQKGRIPECLFSESIQAHDTDFDNGVKDEDEDKSDGIPEKLQFKSSDEKSMSVQDFHGSLTDSRTADKEEERTNPCYEKSRLRGDAVVRDEGEREKILNFETEGPAMEQQELVLEESILQIGGAGKIYKPTAADKLQISQQSTDGQKESIPEGLVTESIQTCDSDVHKGVKEEERGKPEMLQCSSSDESSTSPQDGDGLLTDCGTAKHTGGKDEEQVKQSDKERRMGDVVERNDGERQNTLSIETGARKVPKSLAADQSQISQQHKAVQKESIPESLVEQSIRVHGEDGDKVVKEKDRQKSDGKPDNLLSRSNDKTGTSVQDEDRPPFHSRTECIGDKEKEHVKPSETKEHRMGNIVEGNHAESENIWSFETEAPSAVGQEEPLLEGSLAKESKTKKKKRSKKKAKMTEDKCKTQQTETKPPPEIYQPEKALPTHGKTVGLYQVDNTEGEAEPHAVKQHPRDKELGHVKAAAPLLENTDKRNGVEDPQSVLSQLEQSASSQEVGGNSEQQSPLMSSPPDEQKASMKLKAGESNLKKVFEARVSDKKAVEEVQETETTETLESGDNTRPRSEEEDKLEPAGSKVKADVSFNEAFEKDRLPAVKPAESKRSKKKCKRLKAQPANDNLQTDQEEDSKFTTEIDSNSSRVSPSTGGDKEIMQTCTISSSPPKRHTSYPEESIRYAPEEKLSRKTNVGDSHEEVVCQPHEHIQSEPEEDKNEHGPAEAATSKGLEVESPQTAPLLSEEASPDSGSAGLPTALPAFDSRGAEDDDGDVISSRDEVASASGKSSLVRQDCLEHDQRIMALMSAVRRVEVGLEQQQRRRQSVGRGLVASDDIIGHTQVLDVELRDLEPEIAAEMKAAQKLLTPHPRDVPPELLAALEKDRQSLTRAYQAARTLSEDILRSLRDHRDSYKEAVEAELKSLAGRVEVLLSWLRDTEALVNDESENTEVDDQLRLSEELQSSLTSRSGDVARAASDVQVFVSERAGDLAPQQSERLLGQLQQLQGAFRSAAERARARAAARRERDGDRRRRQERRVDVEEKLKEREVIQQQKTECSRQLEGLSSWLAGPAAVLANQRSESAADSDDVNVLREKQKKLKEVQKDLRARAEDTAEAVRSAEDLLAQRGESLSAEEREGLRVALARLKEQYAALTEAAGASVSEVDAAIDATLQHNMQRAKAFEDLQQTQDQMDSLLKDLTAAHQSAAEDVTDLSSTQPDAAVTSHTGALQTELRRLQAQQAQLLQIGQSARTLLDRPDSTVPPEEKRRLRAALDQLQAEHQQKLHSCQERLRKSEALKDELSKFLQEHGALGAWLEQSELELRCLGEGETDAQELKSRLDQHTKLAEDVICHKADLRFVSISGQKVLDSCAGALEARWGAATERLVTDKLHDANHRYTSLHAKSSDLGGRLSGLLERYQRYRDEVVSLHSWLSAQEQNQSVAKPGGDTDARNLQDTLRRVQLLQDELAERSVQLEKVKRAGRVLVSADESPSLKAVDVLGAADGLEKRFSSLSASVSERAERLQTAVAQSVSVQEGLKALLAWLDTLDPDPAPVQPTVLALQDALTRNQKLRQELLSRQGSVEATRDSVSKLLQSPEASTASGLQGALDELTRRFAAAQVSQAGREVELKALLPGLESFERLAADLRVFVSGRAKALSPAGQPDRSVDDYRQAVEEVKSALQQEAPQLESFCGLAEEVCTSRVLGDTQNLRHHVETVSDDFQRLEDDVNQRLEAISACEQQLLHFRGLSGALLRWLQAAQEQLPAKELALDTEALQRRVEQLQELLEEWESQASRVQELNKSGSELEAQVIDITAPQSKRGAPQMNGSAGPGSVNGIHTCKDLTEIQAAVSDVSARHEALGADLTERLCRRRASLEQRRRAGRGADELRRWLKDKEETLALEHAASPSKPEVVRAQAQENKALLSELAERSAQVEELKGTLKKLIADNPDSPEADAWNRQLREIDARWLSANQTASRRQAELEARADRLGSFAAAAAQLGPWLREKELMMSVLGPLSIDPNMLNTQQQQVQFMLREFETRRQQFDQLTQSAGGILSQTRDPKELEEVRTELDSVSRQWRELTGELDRRSEQIGRARGTSERYRALLHELSASAAALGERLDGRAELSACPEALRRRLRETGEIRSELERRRGELARAERLCEELSAIVAEPYLKDELKKRLASVSAPLKSLEERAADGLSQLRAALSSTQQFQQMFQDVRSWLDRQAELRDPSPDALPCRPEAVRSLLSAAADLRRAVAAQGGSYELIRAEGASLLAALPAGGEERAALQSRLARLRQDWEDVNGRLSEREDRLKSTLSEAESYRRHKAEFTAWLDEREEKDAEIRPSLDSTGLDEALRKARGLALDPERRQPLLEAFNAAADRLLEQCCVGDDEVRDEKTQLNRRLDALAERLLGRTSRLEELSGRLKEFEEGRQAAERRLEAAEHQIEVQEALGPQACSAKSLERLRSQQETLACLQPRVVYLRDLAQGLAQDAPLGPGGGAQGLQDRAEHTQRQFDHVSAKLERCCSTLESRLHGVGEVQSHVRDVFSRLGDLDDELDALGPVGRDADSLASQADALGGFLSRLAALRAELEAHAAECAAMLRLEGSSPDLLALRRETEALGRQAGKLNERGQARLARIRDASERVGDFYRLAGELRGLLGAAEEGLDAQGVVGSEVDVIERQLKDFKALEREQVDGVQAKLQHINAVGQGLIQSAAKNTDTRALEHDLDQTNQTWNSLNKRVAERIARLQEALLHCGKFQDALEPLLSWLSDTEELVANQKPPSAEYRVVKAQIQEQKLLQRLLDDRRPTVEMIRAEGERIAGDADAQDREKIRNQLRALAQRWSDLLREAGSRQRQLEELQVLALHFHEALEPLGEWLSATERRLSSAEPTGTQAAEIGQQIVRHKAFRDDVRARESDVARLRSLSQSLAPLSCASDRDWLGERAEAVRSGHAQLSERCARREALLEQALANARLFGEDEVEVLNWLAEVGQRLAQVSVRSYRPDVLAEQHERTLSLNEEIVSRKTTVDQAVKNGQALLKQTTGEEVLLIQEKLDSIKSRYAEMTTGSGKALRTLEQALQLATRFAGAHRDLNEWLDGVEAELDDAEPDAEPAYQERQKELKNASAEKRLVLDTVNEAGGALLDLVPWRAREGLDRLMADANQRYRRADDTVTQRVRLVQAAIQRSQQYEEAVDAELAWAGETERKLASLGPLSLEPDVTVAQLRVQKAFNIDIIRHKDAVDQLLATRDDILETCGHAQKDALTAKTDSLSARYDAVNRSHSERFAALEQAQALAARFWETHEELEPWLGETETLVGRLPPPAVDADALRLQQDQMRLLRESIAEHKPHIDKLLKIGPALAELSATEGPRVTRCHAEAERRYLAVKEEVKGRAALLDEAVSQSAQFHDKMDPLLETLEAAAQRLRQPPPVAAEVDKIREQLGEHRTQGLELDKLLPSFSALCARGEELIGRAAHDDPAARAVHSRLLRLRSLWDEIRQRAEERESKLDDVLDLAGKFWADVAALLSTLRDSQDIVKELEDPGVDPSLIKQQIEAAEAIKAETDGLREELEFVRTLGADLIFACGETEKPEVNKTIDEMNGAWEGLNRTWRERTERLDEAMSASVQYQDALQSMFDYLDNAVIKLCEMLTVGTDLGTVKQQIEELKQYKVDVYQQQIDMEKLCHQGELLLKKVSDQTDRDMIQEPLTELRHLWDNLGDKITQRQHKLEAALLALGQFQHALSELQAWLSHTYATLDTRRPVGSDPKAIEIELAKHHVLRNDVLSHHATVEAVNAAAAELLESSPGDEAGHLREQLDRLDRSWQNLLLKTQEKQKLLEAALQQAEGFHGELEEFLQWMRRTESQLSAAKPTGGLPETAKEQLEQHTELQAQLSQRADRYHRLLDAGESLLLARGGEDAGPGTTQTQQNLAVLQNKWAGLNAKMDDRRAKLDEALALASGFQTCLQDTINWLTQAEQTLNTAQPPSLLLDTVLFQIDEHKVFVNEVNTHREQVLALEKSGSQLRFASLKQDVVLIKNLLLSVQARWDKLVQRSLDRGRHLDEARKRAKQFHEAWRKLSDWLEEAENRLDSELEIPNEPDKIKVQLSKHKEFQKALGSKQPVYDTTVRSGRAMRDKAQLPADAQKLDHLVGEVRDKWDTVCGKSVERQHKLEEALLFSGQFAEALQALVDWLYRVEPQLAEDLPVHGDLDLVSNLMDSHKAFQKEMGKRTGSVQALKRSARDLMETGRDDTAWVRVQLQELSNRWETVCALSVTKQTRLQQALKQAEEFRTAVQMLLEWLSEAEQSLRFRGVLPEEAETLQALLRTHRQFMGTVEEKRAEVNRAAGMGEAILALCHPDSITTIKHWITIIRARFEEVLTWAKQHEQRLEAALTEVLNNANLLEELLSWLQWAETTLVQRDTEPLPQDIPQVKGLITEHQMFMEEMTRKQPDVDKVTKSYKRKPAEAPGSLAERRGGRRHQQQQQQQQLHHHHQQASAQAPETNPRLNQLCARWQQVWLLALDRQRKLNDALDRLEELKEFANFDFDVWRKKYMRWMNHKKSRVMDFFRRIDKDQDGKITRQEFIDGILASKFPTSKLEMTAVADIFDRDGDGYIDYYEFVAALHPNKDAYRPTTDADKIEDEVTRQVAQCKCAKRFQVEQIGENKYRFFLGNQFGDSQQLRLVRILRSTVMVRVGGGWMALDEFLVKNDPCRARGRTNLELRERFILPEGTPQGVCAFRSRGRRSKPGSRNASPTRSSSSASHSGASAPATPTASASSRSSHTHSRDYAKPWLAHSKSAAANKCPCCPGVGVGDDEGASSGSKLKRPTFHSSRGSLTGENGGSTHAGKRSDPKRAGSSAGAAAGRAGSRAGSRRGSDASDASELQDARSVCSDASDTPRRPGGAKPSKIPTITKKSPSPKTPAPSKK
ncbi:microtubule-actin cross-linking factor 1 isoform X4 [Phycodurus eques]|uniref:microtubule-actin cross-linking factor 1 isoform X4 n=1 Tax=Phycodurus eques TaxID=693459 RepID=UPI002ACD953E|nr:microtubule-actin cross-linking factor 1 isoform X4 [Phycodurus eques]